MTDILGLLTVFVLAAFVGFEVISKVPSILHTPLMSGTNAIHGVILVGSMIVLGTDTARSNSHSGSRRRVRHGERRRRLCRHRSDVGDVQGRASRHQAR